MHIKNLLLQLSEDSMVSKLNDQKTLYPGVKTIEEFEQQVKQKEPEWFMEPTELRKTMKPGQKLNQNALQKSEAFGIWQRDGSSEKTLIPPGAYPFYSFLMPLLVKQLKNSRLGGQFFTTIVNKGLRGKNPFDIKENFGSEFIKNIYNPVLGRVKNKLGEEAGAEKVLKVLNHENFLKRMIDGSAKVDEVDTILDSLPKESKNDDEEDFEKPREEKSTNAFKRVEAQLKKSRINVSGEENKKLLNSIINKYPDADDEEILTTYALASDDSPPTMPITISGQTFTKAELLKILQGMSESILEMINIELNEVSILPRIKKLIKSVRSGKTKEELLQGDVENDEEDIKGYAAQVNRIKEKTLKSKQRQVNIGKSLRDFLNQLEVPTAKLKTRGDLMNLGKASFDSIIKGLQGKENEIE